MINFELFEAFELTEREAMIASRVLFAVAPPTASKPWMFTLGTPPTMAARMIEAATVMSLQA